MSRIFPGLAGLILAMGLVALQAGPVLAQGADPAATITLTPNRGSPGVTSVTIRGKNFAPNLLVDITYDGESVGIVNSGSGSWSHRFVVPASTAGFHAVQAGSAVANFIAATTVSLSANRGSVGTRIVVKGNSFHAFQTNIPILFDDEQVALAATDTAGSFIKSFTVPAAPGGNHAVTVGDMPAMSFTVTPSLAFSPDRGPAGTRVQVSGAGFESNGRIQVNMGSVLLNAFTSDAEGVISGSFQVGAWPGGPRIVTTSGSTAGRADATFTVTPSFSLDRSNASPGVDVTINGAGFVAGETGITVKFDGEPVASAVNADNEGRWSTAFTVPSSAAGFHFLEAFGAITLAVDVPPVRLVVGAGLSLDSPSGPPGSSLRVAGFGARKDERITITAGEALVQTEAIANSQGEWSAEVIVPVAPRGPLTITAAGAARKPGETRFMVTPTIFLASEPTGPPGTTIIVKGDGFDPRQAGIPVRFAGAIGASVTSNAVGSWTARVTVPPTPKGDYSISVPDASGDLEVSFSVTARVSLAEARGIPNAFAVVTGSGFSPNDRGIKVTLGQTEVASAVSANSEGSWTASFTVPSLPGGDYTVLASGSETSAGSVTGAGFTLVSHISIDASSGTVGQVVMVTGEGFGAAEEGIIITYDGATVVDDITAGPLGSFATSFRAPPSASGSHFVGVVAASAAAGASESAASFFVAPDISVSRASGSPGMSMRVKGSGFGAGESGIVISLDSSPMATQVTADARGSFTSSFRLPPTPAGPRVIRATGSRAAATIHPERPLTIVPSLEISSLEGPVGADLKVTGHGFQASAPVILAYDDLTEANAIADASGSFTLSFAVPRSKRGSHLVKALDDEGNKVQASFSVESSPPAAPALLSPENEARGGLLGGFRPSTRWSSVSDPSGVAYILQIDPDPKFSEPFIEKRDLASLVYGLSPDEALPRGAYYWRVKAIDGASNESEWSPVFVMRSGILPAWALPVAGAAALLIVLGGALALVRQRARRRRRALMLPELVRVLKPGAAGELEGETGAPALRPAPRLALPTPFRRERELSPDDQARLTLAMDFVRSIPLIRVSPDLRWMEELVEKVDPSALDAYDLALQGEVELAYRPAWLQHPTYGQLREAPQARALLEWLDEYREAVEECAAGALQLLRSVNEDAQVAASQETLGENRWRFVFSVGQSAMGWFRGTYLEQPSARDYVLDPGPPQGEAPSWSLGGEEWTPFQGPILEGLREEEAVFLRDLHLRLRADYMTSDDARLLAAKTAATEALRDRLLQATSRLGLASPAR